MRKEIPVGVASGKFNDSPIFFSLFPYLETAFDLHWWTKGTGIRGDILIMYKMEFPVKAILKAEASECFGYDEGDYRAPIRRVIEELYGEGTHSSKGRITYNKDIRKWGYRPILKEILFDNIAALWGNIESNLICDRNS